MLKSVSVTVTASELVRFSSEIVNADGKANIVQSKEKKCFFRILENKNEG